MNRLSKITAVSGCLFMCSTLTAGEIDQGLEEVFELSEPGEVISTLVFLWEQVDVDGLVAQQNAERASLARRNEEVVRTLQETAELTQADLVQELTLRQNGAEIAEFEPYWIANMIRVDATEPVIRELAQHPDVKLVYWNMPIGNIETVEDEKGDDVAKDRLARSRRGLSQDVGGDSTALGGPEAGIDAVRAPEVWSMGFTGEGVLVATMDTGVDGNHPALASRWRGLDPAYANNPEWAWFDPITSTTFPQEFGFSSHGTHTMGTVLGGAPGDQVGVAPGAEWIHAGVIDRGGIDATIANAILSFQWMAAPTGDPGDAWAIPRVCSNSWGTVASHGHPACDETFWQWIDNSEAAGTIQLFAAGNEGSSSNTLRRPADRAQKNGTVSDYHSVAVGAIDPFNASWPVASFSSRGPSFCTPDGSSFVKPNLSAPGVSTRSAVEGGGYGSKSGTSMAVPHVNGVVALMIEACDVLSNDEIKQILYDTAHDLGTSGKNNTYGWGMVDAVEAVNMAIAQCTIGIQLPDGTPSMLDPGESASFLVQVTEGTESVVPGSEQLFYRTDGGAFNSEPLTPLGDGLYEADLPVVSCDDSLEFYVQVEGDGGSVRTSPSNAPDNLYSVLVGHFEITEVHYQDFANGLPSGWSATGLWHTTNSCSVGGPCEPGPQYAYYGSSTTCDYDTGNANQGEMLSAPIAFPDIAPGESMTLEFCYNLETEGSTTWDLAIFSIPGTSVSQQLSEASQWTTYSVDVTALAGETHTLSWDFDTVDGVLNDFRGWQVDRVRIEVEGLVCEDVECSVFADLNCDDEVNVKDLFLLLEAWGPCDDPSDCPADLTESGDVNVEDLFLLLENWG